MINVEVLRSSLLRYFNNELVLVYEEVEFAQQVFGAFIANGEFLPFYGESPKYNLSVALINAFYSYIIGSEEKFKIVLATWVDEDKPIDTVYDDALCYYGGTQENSYYSFAECLKDAIFEVNNRDISRLFFEDKITTEELVLATPYHLKIIVDEADMYLMLPFRCNLYETYLTKLYFFYLANHYLSQSWILDRVPTEVFNAGLYEEFNIYSALRYSLKKVSRKPLLSEILQREGIAITMAGYSLGYFFRVLVAIAAISIPLLAYLLLEPTEFASLNAITILGLCWLCLLIWLNNRDSVEALAFIRSDLELKQLAKTIKEAKTLYGFFRSEDPIFIELVLHKILKFSNVLVSDEILSILLRAKRLGDIYFNAERYSLKSSCA